MSPDLRKRLWLVALVVLLAIPLVFLISRAWGGFVRDVVAVPLLYLAWIGRLYLNTVPQAIFWGALVLFGLMLAVTNALIALGGPAGREKDSRYASVDRVDRGPVGRLTSQIHFATRSNYFRRRLAQRLGRLILRSLGYAEQYRPAAVERGLDTLDAAPEIRAFFRAGAQPFAPSRTGSLAAWLRRRLLGRQELGAADVDFEEVVRFLEDRLEVS